MSKYRFVTDELIRKFLVEIMLTGEWGDEYHFLVDNAVNEKRVPNGMYEYNWHTLFADYVYEKGLVKISKKRGQIYELSVRGRKWLERNK